MSLPLRVHISIREKSKTIMAAYTFREEEYNSIDDMVEDISAYLGEELLGEDEDDE